MKKSILIVLILILSLFLAGCQPNSAGTDSVETDSDNAEMNEKKF